MDLHQCIKHPRWQACGYIRKWKELSGRCKQESDNATRFTIVALAGSDSRRARLVKKALTNGSAGKKYDLSFRMKPSYLEGDFNGDGKMDTAVLVKESSTGNLGLRSFMVRVER